MREFWRGAATLIDGVRWWRHRPRLMAAGLIPAAIVGLVLSAAIVALALALPSITSFLTPFADSWDEVWSTLLRLVLGAALLAGSVVLAIVTFTALTLVVGEPFYDRIWRSVEQDLGGSVPDAPYGLWRSVGDSASLVARGAFAALCAGLTGLVPVIGGACAAVLGALLNGRVLADELASRALTARGLPASERARFLRGHRARVLGFGVAVHVCFLIPFAAIAMMPAAVAGATLLARHVAGEPSTLPPRAPQGS
ncbi:EI24 domain-containing protein [Microbacterium album]|uniref:Membrane protein n=1 Tax=Microbacterium album TaxID=2053191 RepID=A0A917IF62_9MICO|nr:EI24 domain-containing protein [Microbacterium album]GGH37817.1 membrane protein [Microbacterium album]